MKNYIQFKPIDTDISLHIHMLKTIVYSGALWGLYHQNHQGWAIKSEDDLCIFPFWFSAAQANKYASKHWPHYIARKITPKDFKTSLLPTLKRLNVTPILFNHRGRRFQLNAELLQIEFFNSQNKEDQLIKSKFKATACT